MIEQISADIRSVVSSPEFAEKVGPLGVFPKGTSPQELDAMIRKEIERWTAIAETANITVLDASSPGSAACGRSNPVVASATPLTPVETGLPAAPRNGRRSQTAL